VVEFPSKESFVDVIVQFRGVCKKFSKFPTFVETTILHIVKEKFARAWTARVLHFGNRTTKRLEEANVD